MASMLESCVPVAGGTKTSKRMGLQGYEGIERNLNIGVIATHFDIGKALGITEDCQVDELLLGSSQDSVHFESLNWILDGYLL